MGFDDGSGEKAMKLPGLPSIPAPWMLYIKLGLIAAVFLFGAFVGCKAQSARDNAKLERKGAIIAKYNEALNGATAQLRVNTTTFRAITAHARSEAKRAADNQAAGEAAAKQARKDKAKYEKKLTAIERALEAAKKADPDCRKLLESPTCAALH